MVGTATATGALSVRDADANASHNWSLQGSPSTTYGTMSIQASSGVWTYTLDNSLAATQALKEGEVVTQTYIARATDDFGAWVDQTLTITIHGTNDAPVISSSAAQASGVVREQGNNDDGSVSSGMASVSNRIIASDADRDATRVYELEGSVSTRYGSIALNRDTGEWTYTLNNTLVATQNLREGQSVQERYTVRVTDDRGAQVRQTITVTVEGSNDAPTVVDALEYKEYLQGEQMQMPTAQLFSDIDLDAGSFSFTAELPAGMQIDAQTGIISGAGTRPGDYRIVIRATDAQGAWAEATWSIRINAPARNESSSTNSSTRNSGAGDPQFSAGSTAGSGTNGNTSGTSRFDVLGAGIPGFSSTIPVPSLPPISSATVDGPASSVNAVPAPASSSIATGTNPGDAGNSAGNSTAGTSGTTSGGTTSGTGTEGAGSSNSASTGSGNAGNNSARPESAPQVQERTEASAGADGQLQLDTRAVSPQAGTSDESSSSRSVERVNVAVNANGQITLRQEGAPVNDAPSGIMLVEVSQQQQGIQIEIADFRRSEVSRYRATLPNGDPLPSWIQVDPATGKVTASPGTGTPLIELKFIAEDASGGTRAIEIKIDLSQQGQRAQYSSETAPVVSGRTAFSSQLAMHHQQWDGYGQQILSEFTE